MRQKHIHELLDFQRLCDHVFHDIGKVRGRVSSKRDHLFCEKNGQKWAGPTILEHQWAHGNVVLKGKLWKQTSPQWVSSFPRAYVEYHESPVTFGLPRIFSPSTPRSIYYPSTLLCFVSQCFGVVKKTNKKKTLRISVLRRVHSTSTIPDSWFELASWVGFSASSSLCSSSLLQFCQSTLCIVFRLFCLSPNFPCKYVCWIEFHAHSHKNSDPYRHPSKAKR